MRPELHVDLEGFRKTLGAVAREQLPFAVSLALTATAGEIGLAWQGEMEAVLDNPTPFTLRSVSVRAARKSDPVASVFIRPIAAEYLEPFVEGGPHFLGGKRGLLSPRNVPLNKYGNLTRNKLAALKAKPNVYVGKVRLKSGGEISGVWQRPTPSARRRASKGNAPGLKLLIRFADPKPVTQHLRFYERAQQIAPKVFASHLAAALERALATAR